MKDLAWLVKHRLLLVEQHEYCWAFTFDGDAKIVFNGLWRLIQGGRIACTSEDDGQQFGLPAPINALEELNRCLSGAEVESVALQEGTLDIALFFSGGFRLESISTSSGYEAWDAYDGVRRLIGVGGGTVWSSAVP